MTWTRSKISSNQLRMKSKDLNQLLEIWSSLQKLLSMTLRNLTYQWMHQNKQMQLRMNSREMKELRKSMMWWLRSKRRTMTRKSKWKLNVKLCARTFQMPLMMVLSRRWCHNSISLMKIFKPNTRLTQMHRMLDSKLLWLREEPRRSNYKELFQMINNRWFLTISREEQVMQSTKILTQTRLLTLHLVSRLSLILESKFKLEKTSWTVKANKNWLT